MLAKLVKFALQRADVRAMQPPPLCGEPGWLEECDYVQLRKILRENGAVAAHELAHITSKIELISLCHTYGIGPTVPDELICFRR